MIDTMIGMPYPLGCTPSDKEGVKGFNFALYSSLADSVELCVFSKNQPERRIPMQRTDNIWHIFVVNVDYGDQYGFRLLSDDDNSLINPNKLMLDPYAKMVIGKPDLSSEDSRKWFLQDDPRDNAEFAPKSVITETDFDWEKTTKPNISWAKTVIYEAHIKGFTQLRDDLPESIRGTYAGLCHPNVINYLKELGITSIELLPINYHLDEVHLQEKGLHNYWGYSPLAMFAVESEYWSKQKGTTALTEFKTMVKTLHQAGIEVILDVVFNHTVESEKNYPTFCQRGIDNKTYYWYNENGDYINWTGCGNMLNLSTQVARKWVIDCLRYWAEECHVDGFRFDLASVLGRETPYFNQQALLFKEIEAVPSLRNCKFIAEPWDIGEGGYQVGNFPEYFSEWNDRFRDDICKFWLWKSGELGAFAERFAGSSDIYKKGERSPHNSVNFITAHDGFTLRDLVSYNQKHNFDNVENNQDGRNENYSYNHEFEGSIGASESVEKRRFLTSISVLSSLLLANGTPMLLAGDEFGNSQFGNNNAYCQDNQIAWLKWQDFNDELFQFTKCLIALRKRITLLNEDSWWNDETVSWFNSQGQLMEIHDWNNRKDKAFQILLNEEWLLLVNGKEESQNFSLPFLSKEWDILSGSAVTSLQDNFAIVENLALCVLHKK
ncbi:glycogen operon protein [Bisgaardia hudsonensis]|uniref:Glycogen operon protein n=1 Tax=Bisgaardia hudsonensis TaxID=109472 RepID=A0A4R2N1F0_9PAST|nr:glycogen debranching protein GlgX [Bisgaardia hudsonensis]QLB13075.1 glycogen debranching enzyme GlgX [Bisgaardia hudsonensis]TCP13358.1 glycogen operon protein [Bisgaardia hudsonensis]